MKFFLTHFFLFAFLANAQQQITENDIPFVIFDYDCNSCNAFNYPSGSIIIIPADAFDLPSCCNGQIKIKYREFHSKFDFFVGNLNTRFLAKGENSFRVLESAGMFEWRAECNGKLLTMKGDKEVQIRMKMQRNLPDLCMFKFNENGKYFERFACNQQDFSYNSQKNEADNKSLWGGRPSPDMIKAIDPASNPEDPMVFERMAWVKELPEGIFKSFNVRQPGIYNYDRVIDDPNAVKILADFKFPDGSKVDDKVYVSYKNINSIIEYYPEDFLERFVLLNKYEIEIFATKKDGRVGVLKPDFFETINIQNFKDKNLTFDLQYLPQKPKNKFETAKQLKLSNQ